MVYLIQGDEVETSPELRERMAQVMAESGELTLADTRYRIRSGQGILQFHDRTEAERVAARFTEMGFANSLLDELLEPPKMRLLGVGAEIPKDPMGLVALVRLATETTRVVTDVEQMGARVGYGMIPGLGFEIEQDVVTDRDTRYVLDLYTREQHWRVKAGMLPRIVDVFTAVDVSEAYLSEGARSLSRTDRDVPTFTSEKLHEKYLMWLYQMRFA
jgi:hypothetical protein